MAVKPTTETTSGARVRLAGVDLARGLAVFGMFAVHLGPEPGTGGFLSWLTGIVQGRSAALFVLLAGVSLALLTGGRCPKRGADRREAVLRIAIRAVILLLLGTGLTMLGTSVLVILAYYGVFFLLALPFLRLRAGTLAVLAGAVAILGPVLAAVARPLVQGGHFAEVSTAHDPLAQLSGEGVLRLLLTGNYPAITWMAFVFAGMALGRLDLAAVHKRLAVAGAALVVLGYGGSWFALGLVETAEIDLDEEVAALLDTTPHTGTPFEIAGTLGIAIMVLSAALVLAPRFPRAVLPVEVVGRMALTAYVAHVLAIGALGIGEVPERPLLALTAFVVTIGAGLLLWSRFFRRGPLEFLMHRATEPARLLRRR
ncbi:heparan-alpha-glucosaminide N-acetyltransferase domain-containing protein [Amycolatopsis anabasis]|uniref:heparan-alpha-glucosaminide N-acetyltransferase domain-containing protein n=1 Tax=Amycolatopsis anabasis TaxID=1840409 RepID=UPI00131D4D78|nr:heparan-alpha-glucosaminide N-acetyltransferase domain-containing protein [Amycolatopsis anabasis]